MNPELEAVIGNSMKRCNALISSMAVIPLIAMLAPFGPFANFLLDHLGSMSLLVDSSQARNIVYMPFGGAHETAAQRITTTSSSGSVWMRH